MTDKERAKKIRKTYMQEFYPVNKTLHKCLGLGTTLVYEKLTSLYQFLADKNKTEDGWFYCKLDVISAYTGLSIHWVRCAIQTLKQNGFIETQRRNPAKPTLYRISAKNPNEISSASELQTSSASELQTRVQVSCRRQRPEEPKISTKNGQDSGPLINKVNKQYLNKPSIPAKRDMDGYNFENQNTNSGNKISPNYSKCRSTTNEKTTQYDNLDNSPNEQPNSKSNGSCTPSEGKSMRKTLPGQTIKNLQAQNKNSKDLSAPRHLSYLDGYTQKEIEFVRDWWMHLREYKETAPYFKNRKWKNDAPKFLRAVKQMTTGKDAYCDLDEFIAAMLWLRTTDNNYAKNYILPNTHSLVALQKKKWGEDKYPLPQVIVQQYRKRDLHKQIQSKPKIEPLDIDAEIPNIVSNTLNSHFEGNEENLKRSQNLCTNWLVQIWEALNTANDNAMASNKQAWINSQLFLDKAKQLVEWWCAYVGTDYFCGMTYNDPQTVFRNAIEKWQSEKLNSKLGPWVFDDLENYIWR